MECWSIGVMKKDVSPFIPNTPILHYSSTPNANTDGTAKLLWYQIIRQHPVT
jgi:hypothetical protein